MIQFNIISMFKIRKRVGFAGLVGEHAESRLLSSQLDVDADFFARTVENYFGSGDRARALDPLQMHFV